jgi:adenosylmethionine-8-amino-7-oxononanoate aminotransferase
MEEDPRPVAARARGVFVYDEAGADYLDGSSGPVCVNIGHGVPEVVEAIGAQAASLAYVYRTQFRTRPLEELTDLLLELAPPGMAGAAFTNGGSEANEAALRIAMLAHGGDPGRTVVLTQHPSYHGMTAGVLSLSGHPGRRQGLDALHRTPLAHLVHADPSSRSLIPTIADWERELEEVGPGRVAGIMLEPVGGAAGGATAVPPETLAGLRELCTRHGAWLILDEVMTGFGRTGAWFDCLHAGVSPDLLVVGKGLTGGYAPMGACLVHERVVERLDRPLADVAFGHTMAGNPLSAATSLAVLRYAVERRLPELAAERGTLLRAELERLAGRFPFLTGVRGRGMLLSLGLDQAAHPGTGLVAAVVAAAFRERLIVYPAGVDAATAAVLVAPPLTIEAAEIATLVERLEAALAAVQRTL